MSVTLAGSERDDADTGTGHTPGRDLGLVIDPPASKWPELVGSSDVGEAGRQMRRELGLPEDRPVVMSGHQAEFWGPGILAKWIAGVVGAEALGACAAWLVADQDVGDAAQIRYPDADDDGSTRPGEARLDPARAPGEGAKPTSRQAPIDAGPATPGPLKQIASALRAHEQEPDAARQVQAALAGLAEPICPPPQAVFARELSRTTLFAELVDRMRQDPAACARAYNDAVARHPDAGVRPLVETDEARGVELPLWLIDEGGRRRRVTAAELADATPEQLAPRALLLTALVRLGACDLFIHGTGGGAYDQIMEDWIGAWLDRRPAPAAVVTATVLPDVPGVDLGAVERAERAAWRAHAAAHNPGLVGDERAADAKRELVGQIEAAKRAGLDPAPHFRRLHGLLAEFRGANSSDLGALTAEAERLTAQAAGSRRAAQVARDRTLAFPLMPRERLLALRDAIRGEFARIG